MTGMLPGNYQAACSNRVLWGPPQTEVFGTSQP